MKEHVVGIPDFSNLTLEETDKLFLKIQERPLLLFTLLSEVTRRGREEAMKEYTKSDSACWYHALGWLLENASGGGDWRRVATQKREELYAEIFPDAALRKDSEK